MDAKDLKNGVRVKYLKSGKGYRVVSCNMRMKVTGGQWVDGVVYAPWYESDYECFCRERDSFLAEFEIVEE